ncbi:MAG TPA: hypothetical protein VEC37_04620 [Bacillota bacterium]|nr:hypothetical protein [Bacillota bacterium]
MRNILKKISSSVYILIIILFFLPFVSVSCDNKEVTRLTGIQMVTGTAVTAGGLLWQEKQRIPPQPLAIASFSLAIVSLTLGFVRGGKLIAGLQTLLSSGAALSLYLLKTKLSEDVLRYPKMVFVINYLPCYWIALGLFILVAVMNGAGFFMKRKDG